MASELENQLLEDMKAAMKSGDKVRRETLRVLRAQIKNAAISSGKDLSQEAIIAVIDKEVKKRKESIDLYLKGGRQDLADQEEREAEILADYLPEQLSEDDLRSIVRQTVAEVEARSMKEMGRVMGTLMPKIQGRADGKRAQQIVREILG